MVPEGRMKTVASLFTAQTPCLLREASLDSCGCSLLPPFDRHKQLSPSVPLTSVRLKSQF